MISSRVDNLVKGRHTLMSSYYYFEAEHDRNDVVTTHKGGYLNCSLDVLQLHHRRVWT